MAADNLGASAKDQAERILRDIWALIAGGRHFPVDPIRIAGSLDITVYRVPLDQRLAGVLVKESGRDVAILLNDADSKNRQRFTCAHEIGHYVRRETTLSGEYNVIDERSQLTSTGSDETERLANQFAACLLMPEDEVKKRVRKGLPAYELVSAFGVSQEALGWRLADLKLTVKG